MAHVFSVWVEPVPNAVPNLHIIGILRCVNAMVTFDFLFGCLKCIALYILPNHLCRADTSIILDA